MENKEVIGFTKTKLPYGWLGNMSPYPIQFGPDTYRTTEALFQALRFTDKDIQNEIRENKSPMGAKFVMKANKDKITTEPHSKKDVINMEMCLRLKLSQHPELIDELLATGDLPIIEDVTARGDKGGNLFWGAMLVDGKWVGQNVLGNLWMNLRTSYKENKNKNV